MVRPTFRRRRFRKTFKKRRFTRFRRAYRRKRVRSNIRRNFRKRKTSYRRYRRRQPSFPKRVVTQTFWSGVKDLKLAAGVKHYINSVSFNPKVATDLCKGNVILTYYQTMYDEFRVTQVTAKFWMDALTTVNSTDITKGLIPSFVTAYDPDATGRQFRDLNDFILVGRKPKFVRPYRAYTVKLWPKVSGTNALGIPVMARECPWLDIANIATDGYFPNSVQYCINNIVPEMDIHVQYSFTYQFRGLRNGQHYAGSRVKQFSNEVVRHIPYNDSQNREVEDNFEMLYCNSSSL